MSFLKKLFGTSENESKPSIQPTNLTPTPKRTIFDFFQIDIKCIPDDSFIAGEIEENITGERVQNFRKSLNYKECGIFDTIEVKLIGDEGKNVFLKSFNPERVDFNKLRSLIDDLYLIHGNDSEDKGKFSNKDKKDYKDSEYYMLFGRSWTDFPKYKYPVSINRDEDELSIAIYGVDNK
jgi:hypothetical protein